MNALGSPSCVAWPCSVPLRRLNNARAYLEQGGNGVDIPLWDSGTPYLICRSEYIVADHHMFLYTWGTEFKERVVAACAHAATAVSCIISMFA